MGRGIVVAGLFRSERYELESRTTDPASYNEGEAWLRTDLAPDANQLATLRFYNGTTIYNIPILSLGSSFASVDEALRVPVAGTTGYIPIISPADATFEDLRFQHNGGTTALHDEPGLAAFFDVAITNTNSPITEGENLNVNYSVTNTGEVTDTQNMLLRDFNNSQVDQDIGVSLSGSQSASGTLTWTSPSAGSGTVDVLSDDDLASTSVTIESVIPDSGLDHLWYAPEAASADPWPNELGAIDVDATGTPSLSGSINSTTAMQYDGVDDFHSATQTMAVGPNVEHTFVAVVQSNSTVDNQIVFGNGQTPASDGYRVELAAQGGEWRYIANGIAVEGGGTSTTDAVVLTGTYDGSNAILELNGSQIINTALSTPNDPTTEMEIGGDTDGTEPFDGVIGAIGHESGFGDQARRDELTNAFADAFGISVST